MNLTNKKCVPCERGTPPLSKNQIKKYLAEIDSSWEIFDSKKIKKEFSFKDFVEAIKFVNEVADIAEREGHHPDIKIHYNEIEINLWTHAINGLSENDFIVAAKIDELLR